MYILHWNQTAFIKAVHTQTETEREFETESMRDRAGIRVQGAESEKTDEDRVKETKKLDLLLVNKPPQIPESKQLRTPCDFASNLFLRFGQPVTLKGWGKKFSNLIPSINLSQHVSEDCLLRWIRSGQPVEDWSFNTPDVFHNAVFWLKFFTFREASKYHWSCCNPNLKVLPDGSTRKMVVGHHFFPSRDNEGAKQTLKTQVRRYLNYYIDSQDLPGGLVQIHNIPNLSFWGYNRKDKGHEKENALERKADSICDTDGQEGKKSTNTERIIKYILGEAVQ